MNMRAMTGKYFVRLAGLVVVLVGLDLATAHADALPKSVRIASIGYLVDGKLAVGGNQSSVLETQGTLAAELQKRGIQLEWIPIPSALGGPGFNEALASDKADFASYADFPALIAKAGGIDTKLIVPAGRGTNSYLVVPKTSTAQTIQDLKGKSIALQRGRGPDLAFSGLLARSNLKYSDFKIYDINGSAGAAALVGGSVDALFTGSDAYLLEDKNAGKIIWSTKDTNLKWRAELFVRSDFAKKYPELTQLVATAYVKAAYWSAQDENREAVTALTSRVGTPLTVVQRDYDESLPWKERWSPLFDPYMREHYRQTIEFAKAQKMIARDVDLDQWFDDHYVKTALKDLNLENFWTERQAVSELH